MELTIKEYWKMEEFGVDDIEYPTPSTCTLTFCGPATLGVGTHDMTVSLTDVTSQGLSPIVTVTLLISSVKPVP